MPALARVRPAAAGDLTTRLARSMAGARSRPLLSQMRAAARLNILDGAGAILSEVTLPPEWAAAAYVAAQGGAAQATMLAAGRRTNRILAASGNGMCAPADGTDDFEPVTKAHPGCAVVPAALAFAEAADRSGAEPLERGGAGI